MKSSDIYANHTYGTHQYICHPLWKPSSEAEQNTLCVCSQGLANPWDGLGYVDFLQKEKYRTLRSAKLWASTNGMLQHCAVKPPFNPDSSGSQVLDFTSVLDLIIS